MYYGTASPRDRDTEVFLISYPGLAYGLNNHSALGVVGIPGTQADAATTIVVVVVVVVVMVVVLNNRIILS